MTITQGERKELERHADALLRKYGNNLAWQRGPGCDTWGAAIRAIVEALSLPAPSPAQEAVASADITLREAATDLLRAMHDDQRTVGYRLDLWNCLQDLLTAPQPPEQCANIAQKSEHAPAKGDLWRHRKRGTVYEKLGVAELQTATRDVIEGDGLVVYRGEDGKMWARVADEFHDGRFEALNPRDAASTPEAQCNMPNCRNRARADNPFCSKHGMDERKC